MHVLLLLGLVLLEVVGQHRVLRRIHLLSVKAKRHAALQVLASLADLLPTLEVCLGNEQLRPSAILVSAYCFAVRFTPTFYGGPSHGKRRALALHPPQLAGVAAQHLVLFNLGFLA
jgi:hypothetical protein